MLGTRVWLNFNPHQLGWLKTKKDFKKFGYCEVPLLILLILFTASLRPHLHFYRLEFDQFTAGLIKVLF